MTIEYKKDRDRIYEYAYVYDWKKALDDLEGLAIREDWSFKSARPILQNTKNPILHNYITHTLERLESEREVAITDEEKNKKIYISDEISCFNTGLFTKNYTYIYAYFEKNIQSNKQPWFFKGFFPEHKLRNVYPFPDRAKYFDNINDLIFDTSLQIIPNLDHILDDDENKLRLPETIRNAGNRSMIFDGAISLVRKKIESNYKIAVPQYFKGKIQFLLPLCLDLDDPETMNLVLAVEKETLNGKQYYKGNTGLSLEMAYNNARLISKIDSDWLKG